MKITADERNRKQEILKTLLKTISKEKPRQQRIQKPELNSQEFNISKT